MSPLPPHPPFLLARLLPALGLACALGPSPARAQETAPEKDLTAERFLERLATRNARRTTVRAKYTQARETELSKKPLRSEGVLHYSRKHRCLVLHGEKPRRVVLRLDEDSYQVYHPAKKRAERFVFEGGFSGSALVLLYSDEARRLKRDYEVVSMKAGKGTATVVLRPKSERLRKRLRTLSVTARTRDMELLSFGYSGGDGESVRIDLKQAEDNPELDPALFARNVPEGTDLQITVVKE